MRQLEQSLIRTRSILRRAWSRAGVTDPELVAPSQLVLRVDDADLPGVMGSGKPLTLHQWQQAIAEVVAWIGPVPVTVIATHNADDPEVPELIRFAHRLECATRLVTDGTGITEERAGHFLSCGLSAVRLLVGGVSEMVQRQTVGNAAVEATSALAALQNVRQERDAALDIEIAIPWVEGVTLELSAVIGWARQAGADGFRIVAPYRAEKLPADPELLDSMLDDYGLFCRNSTSSIEDLHAWWLTKTEPPGWGVSTVVGAASARSVASAWSSGGVAPSTAAPSTRPSASSTVSSTRSGSKRALTSAPSPAAPEPACTRSSPPNPSLDES